MLDVVEFLAVAWTDNSTLGCVQWWLINNCAFNEGNGLLVIREPLYELRQGRHTFSGVGGQSGSHICGGSQTTSQRNQVSWCSNTLTHTIDEAFDIPGFFQTLGQARLCQSVGEQLTDDLLAMVQHLDVQERLPDPAPHETPAHGAARLIQHPQQRSLNGAGAPAFKEFQVAPCMGIERHKRVGVVRFQRGKLAQ